MDFSSLWHVLPITPHAFSELLSVAIGSISSQKDNLDQIQLECKSQIFRGYGL